ncbi:MICAL-like protein 1 [Penaeus vannamei]|uniref:MICAL-like protein 1 n=1 Tax=Penaeus vannamei TaxID=6689 RepID=UPI00387FA3E2
MAPLGTLPGIAASWPEDLSLIASDQLLPKAASFLTLNVDMRTQPLHPNPPPTDTLQQRPIARLVLPKATTNGHPATAANCKARPPQSHHQRTPCNSGQLQGSSSPKPPPMDTLQQRPIARLVLPKATTNGHLATAANCKARPPQSHHQRTPCNSGQLQGSSSPKPPPTDTLQQRPIARLVLPKATTNGHFATAANCKARPPQSHHQRTPCNSGQLQGSSSPKPPPTDTLQQRPIARLVLPKATTNGNLATAANCKARPPQSHHQRTPCNSGQLQGSSSPKPPPTDTLQQRPIARLVLPKATTNGHLATAANCKARPPQSHHQRTPCNSGQLQGSSSQSHHQRTPCNSGQLQGSSSPKPPPTETLQQRPIARLVLPKATTNGHLATAANCKARPPQSHHQRKPCNSGQLQGSPSPKPPPTDTLQQRPIARPVLPKATTNGHLATAANCKARSPQSHHQRTPCNSGQLQGSSSPKPPPTDTLQQRPTARLVLPKATTNGHLATAANCKARPPQSHHQRTPCNSGQLQDSSSPKPPPTDTLQQRPIARPVLLKATTNGHLATAANCKARPPQSHLQPREPETEQRRDGTPRRPTPLGNVIARAWDPSGERAAARTPVCSYKRVWVGA